MYVSLEAEMCVWEKPDMLELRQECFEHVCRHPVKLSSKGPEEKAGAVLATLLQALMLSSQLGSSQRSGSICLLVGWKPGQVRAPVIYVHSLPGGS